MGKWGAQDATKRRVSGPDLRGLWRKVNGGQECSFGAGVVKTIVGSEIILILMIDNSI